MAKQFLIIHGWGGTSSEHWQSWLRSELESRGEKVSQPELPNAMNPVVGELVEVIKKEIDSFDPLDELIVLGHSLGPAAWVHLKNKYPEIKAHEVYFVAPAIADPGVPEIANFYPLPEFKIDPETEYLVIASDNDTYLELDWMQNFAFKYNLPFMLLSGQGHLNVAAGYGPWPWILERCLA